jgi:hypothetical protein
MERPVPHARYPAARPFRPLPGGDTGLAYTHANTGSPAQKPEELNIVLPASRGLSGDSGMSE